MERRVPLENRNGRAEMSKSGNTSRKPVQHPKDDMCERSRGHLFTSAREPAQARQAKYRYMESKMIEVRYVAGVGEAWSD